MFPSMCAKGKFKSCEHVNHQNFSELLVKWINLAQTISMIGGSPGHHVLHCFRRRALQHFFMLTINGKWSTMACKWWGGWSESEKVETIFKCLLKDLRADKRSFRGMCSPFREVNKRLSLEEYGDPLTTSTFSDYEKVAGIFNKIGGDYCFNICHINTKLDRNSSTLRFE